MNKTIIVLLLIAIVSCNNLRDLATFDWTKVYNDLVKTHNNKRAKHGAAALTKLAALANLCQTTVNSCKKKQGLYHTSDTYNNNPVGQNLYVIGGAAPTGSGITNDWYSENKNYNYNTGKAKNNGVIGHFTQLVWKASKKIGCAYAKGTWSGFTPSYFVCCNYYPAGNYANQYTKNVGKPTS